MEWAHVATAAADPVLVTLPSTPCPLAIVLSFSSKATTVISGSQMRRVIAESVGKHTDCLLLDVEDLVEGCSGLMGCTARRLREEARVKHTPPPDLLMKVDNAGGGTVDSLTASLVDLDQAAALVAAAGLSPAKVAEVSDATLALDGQILKRATFRERTTDVRTEAEALDFLEQLVAVRFRPKLEEKGHWEPFGEVVISSDRAGDTVELDGEPVAVSQDGELRIGKVRVGSHALRVERPGFEVFESDLKVASGDRVELRPILERDHAALRTATFWSGVGLALLGQGVFAYAVMDAARRESRPCLFYEGSANGCPAQPSFVRLPGSSLLGAPLGYSLVLTGAWWVVSEVLGSPLWLEQLGGPLLGGLAYGLSAALSGPTR
jgi:hypothetical protein